MAPKAQEAPKSFMERVIDPISSGSDEEWEGPRNNASSMDDADLVEGEANEATNELTSLLQAWLLEAVEESDEEGEGIGRRVKQRRLNEAKRKAKAQVRALTLPLHFTLRGGVGLSLSFLCG